MSERAAVSAVVEGPDWCAPGLDYRGGRYPLGVEAFVLNMVDTLVPGLSTLTEKARYFSLYWALAAYAEECEWDRTQCRTALRRAEVGVAWASLSSAADEDSAAGRTSHGADRVAKIVAAGDVARLTELGDDSYSPRAWGFWSQYRGPAVVLGIVSTDRDVLRSGSRSCPPAIRAMFRPLLDIVVERPVTEADLAEVEPLTRISIDDPDLAPLRDVLTATAGGTHDPDAWTPNDGTRRSTLRIMGRAVQRRGDETSWRRMLTDAVVYGGDLTADPVFSQEIERAEAWRGAILRHYSVGAWRSLWSALVEAVSTAGEPVSRDELHDWMRAEISGESVREFLASCPDVLDRHGSPAPAEQEVWDLLDRIERNLAILLFGSLRVEQLSGLTLSAFVGNRASSRGQILDPSWVARRRGEFYDRPLADFACALVDDMLAQAHRVTLRKLSASGGRMVLRTKLHEMNGRYFATGSEGSGNVGLRAAQLGIVASQIGLFDLDDESIRTTDLGRVLLNLPR